METVLGGSRYSYYTQKLIFCWNPSHSIVSFSLSWDFLVEKKNKTQFIGASVSWVFIMLAFFLFLFNFNVQIIDLWGPHCIKPTPVGIAKFRGRTEKKKTKTKNQKHPVPPPGLVFKSPNFSRKKLSNPCRNSSSNEKCSTLIESSHFLITQKVVKVFLRWCEYDFLPFPSNCLQFSLERTAYSGGFGVLGFFFSSSLTSTAMMRHWTDTPCVIWEARSRVSCCRLRVHFGSHLS